MQDGSFFDVDNDDNLQFEYHDVKANRQLMIPTITATNASNQQQQQQQQLPYDVVHDNATNVEAVILQNQVDTLHWQLKQVRIETDRKMIKVK